MLAAEAQLTLTREAVMQAAALAQDLEADQLPLVYWAFATLAYSPSVAVMAALDTRALCLASQLSAQVCSPPSDDISLALAHWPASGH